MTSDPVILLTIGIGLLVLPFLLFFPKGGLIGYWQKTRRFSKRVFVEDALKHMHRCERHLEPITIERLASVLEVSTKRIVKLLEELETQGLVDISGDYYHLTPKGRDYALRIVRTHRLLESYLAVETGFDEAEWHDQADRLEHQLIPEQVEDLAMRIGNPIFDPHGDPIPTPDGDLVHHNGQPLSSMSLNTPLRIVHLEDEPDTIYAQLAAMGLHPGMDLHLVENTPQRIRFWAAGDEHVLAPVFAASISVIPILENTTEPPAIGNPLCSLKPGESAEIVALSPRLRGAGRRRMMDLGILPGTVIKAEMTSPSGDPTAYLVRGALIALRKEQAQLIRVQPVQKTS